MVRLLIAVTTTVYITLFAGAFLAIDPQKRRTEKPSVQLSAPQPTNLDARSMEPENMPEKEIRRLDQRIDSLYNTAVQTLGVLVAILVFLIGLAQVLFGWWIKSQLRTFELKVEQAKTHIEAVYLQKVGDLDASVVKKLKETEVALEALVENRVRRVEALAEQKITEACSRLESQLSAAERQITQKGIEAGVSLETRLEVKLEGAASGLRATYDELIQTIGPADLTQRGKLFYLTQEYSNAAGVLTTSLEQNAQNCEAQYWRGLSYKALGKNEEAIADLENVVAGSFAGKNRGDVHLQLAEAYSRTRNWEVARQHAEHALKHDVSDQLKAVRLIADCLRSQRRYAEAEEKYDECLDISKHDNSSVLGKGLVLARQGKYREAIDLYKRELDYSRDSNYLLYKAGAHWMIGEREQAWANLNDAKITNPRDCKIYEEEARLYVEQAEEHKQLENADGARTSFEAALGAWHTGLRLSPETHKPIVRNELCQCLLKADQAESALDVSKEACDEDPKDARNFVNRTSVLLATKRAEEAVNAAAAGLTVDRIGLPSKIWLTFFHALGIAFVGTTSEVLQQSAKELRTLRDTPVDFWPDQWNWSGTKGLLLPQSEMLDPGVRSVVEELIRDFS